MSEIILNEIWIYPVKGLGGISLASANAMGKGLEWDRRWMLIDDQGTFLTQRTLPMMTQFRVSGTQPPFTVHFGSEEIALTEPESGELRPATIWNDSVFTWDMGDTYATWFSEKLGFPCRLVYFPETAIRNVDPQYAAAGEQVSLADGYPILVIGTASLVDLNSRLTDPVTFRRFRPNLIVETRDPFIEDTWRDFTLGQAEMTGVKPCARCQVITLDPETGVAGKEPLTSLARYRAANQKVYFGQNVLVRKPGVIRVGDHIEVSSFNQPLLK